MIGLSVYTGIVSKNEGNLLVHEIIQLLSLPGMALIILSWIYTHFRFLKVPPKFIEKRLKKMH